MLDDRRVRRQLYFDEAWKTAAGSDVVFFDPDNGLAVTSATRGRRGSSKYLWWDELSEAYGRGHSLVLYQHFPRRPREIYVNELAERIENATSCRDVLALATANVAFMVTPQPRQAIAVSSRLDLFAKRAAPFVVRLR